MATPEYRTCHSYPLYTPVKAGNREGYRCFSANQMEAAAQWSV